MSAQATSLGPKFFVVGTYVQSESMMAEWKARGINTLVENPNGSDKDAWSAAAASSGLQMIRSPSKDLGADLNNPSLLAWTTPDEPSNTGSTLDYGVVHQDPAEVAAASAPLRAAAAAAGVDMPVWTNHVGGHIYPAWAENNALMRDYMEGGESDWLASDSYPIQTGQPLLVDAGDYTSTQQGVSAYRQIEWSGGKSTMTFIGSSAYEPGQDVPSAAELKAQAWSAIINGSEGIIYFPVQLSPWDFDATPPELVKAMTELHKEIASIETILMNETAGGRDAYTVFHAANEGAAPKAGQLPYPFEATEISSEQGTYRIILNLSDKPQVLNKPEWGLSNVTFNGYEVKKGFADGSEPSPAAPATDLVPGEPASAEGAAVDPDVVPVDTGTAGPVSAPEVPSEGGTAQPAPAAEPVTETATGDAPTEVVPASGAGEPVPTEPEPETSGESGDDAPPLHDGAFDFGSDASGDQPQASGADRFRWDVRDWNGSVAELHRGLSSFVDQGAQDGGPQWLEGFLSKVAGDYDLVA